MPRIIGSLIERLTDEWLSPLTNDCLALTREEIERRLCVAPISFYKPDAVWLVAGTVEPVLKRIQVVYNIPEPHYVTAPMDHVAEEQQVRCYNLAAYLLGGLLRDLGDPNFDLPRIDSKCFLLVEKDWRHRRAEPTDEPCTFTLQVEKAYKKAGVAYYQFFIAWGSIQGTIGVFYNPNGSQQTIDKEVYRKLYHRWNRAWQELPRLKLNTLRLIARLYARKQLKLQPVPITV
ncbi:MAG: hypothetical protein AAB669_03700 [Patescibacteria group bacterium]